MNSETEAEKQELLNRISAALQKYLGRGKARAELAERYVNQSFRRVPPEELSEDAPGTIAAMLHSQLGFLEQRSPGEVLIRVFNPTEAEHGWTSSHTVVELVNDDMPFLVDTASLAMAELDIGIHRIVHPVIRVGRDDEGRLKTVYAKSSGRGRPESVIQLQVDRSTDAELLERMRGSLEAVLTDVRRAVTDWKAMEASVIETERQMPEWAAGTDPEWMKECRAFMHWLLEDHFILLGLRDYEVAREKGEAVLRAVPGSGLGILRENGRKAPTRPLSSLAPAVRRKSHKRPLIITKTNARSTVHRAGYMDYIGVLKIDARGRTVGERRYLGLFTSRAYTQLAMETPMVRVRARNIMSRSGLVEGSHAWKSMVHILETLPRDELLQATSNQLQEIAEGVLSLQERKLVRLFIRKERYGRFYSCLVYLPREQFNTENREKIQSILKRALKGRRLDYNVHVAESRLARLQVLVRPRPGASVEYDVEALQRKIIEAVRSWADELGEILIDKLGEEDGLELLARFGNAFPEAFKEDVSPWVASFDVVNAAAVDRGEPMRMSLYRPRISRGGIIRFKLFRKSTPVPLSNILPVLENLGLHIVNERPYELNLADGEKLWIQDFDMVPDVGRKLDLEIVGDLFVDAFRRTVEGEADNDGFNRLVIAAQMNWRQVMVLRAYCRYLLQTAIPFSASYMAETLARHPGISRLLIELFESAFDPAREGESDFRRERASERLSLRMQTLFGDALDADPVLREYLQDLAKARRNGREAQITAVRRAFKRALATVASLDEDRILYAFYEVIGATLRSSYFQRDAEGNPRDYTSFKLDSQALPNLPQPRPYREIWVYSPRFEGVHLRGGPIARGGLRWSDRKEDFRTEVLGLMKAQNVKNTMIVPVGAKGGFVVKAPSEGKSRDEVFTQGVDCYKSFINGLLDITDNLDDDKVIPPDAVFRVDGDDPYLVVAADKGTATFSDTANEVSAKHGFWLGDAFASGGSVGYDHKALGITARGAWESVKRHFREMGRNIQKEPFTVVGIGDMSGDVFGNGMLLSRHTQLQAAFNHQHIFLDPNPEEKTSYAERRRLFRKARSSWMDYRPELISAGGGVFSRQDKTVPISPQVREWLGIEATELTPNALIRELLKAPVDLLWNGGIGTYVKARAESHADVGDLANNAVRVDGCDLRCRAIGEGGNLGLTQLGRVEYARAGGFINTDFIDNSAGVDTSDHEVNIKILLNQLMRSDLLDETERRTLLADMSKEVAAQVLRSNYLQTAAISMMESFSAERLGSMKHFIRVLEEKGVLDRELEFLPEDEELDKRQERGEGLCRPELAVLLSYSKITLYQELLASDVPEDAWLSDEAVDYFPAQIRKRFGGQVASHRLKREIVATQVTNSLVNRMGASFMLRVREDTGASAGDVARAYAISREVFLARDFWRSVERLDNRVDSTLQIAAMMNMWNLLRQSTRWLLNLEGRHLDIRRMIERLAPGLKTMEGTHADWLSDDEQEALHEKAAPFMAGGFPKKLATRAALLEYLFPALDVVETSARRRTSVKRVADVFFGLSGTLELGWLRAQVETLKVSGQWHAVSRALLRDELFRCHNQLVEDVLKEAGRKKDPMGAWLESRKLAVNEVVKMLAQMRKQPQIDYAMVSVAVRSLWQLADGDKG